MEAPVRRALLLLLLIASGAAAAGPIKGPPTASRKSVQQVARLGSEVRLVCPMEGNPAPIIEWSRGDTLLTYIGDMRYKTGKKSLKIRDVDMTDSGRFVCKGINGFGKEEIQIDLVIIDPADFPGLPEGALPEVAPPALTSETLTARRRLDRRPDDTLRLTCQATGKPRPQITWYKNGHELLENVREGKAGRSVLQVRGLMVRDAGTYSCVARNMVGEDRRDFELAVADRTQEQPDFSHSPMNRTVREGETATFDCRVRSLARPHIKWLKKLEAGDTGYNQSEVIPVGTDSYRLIHTSRELPLQGGGGETLSQLVLRSVAPGEAGMYVCFVTSPRGGFNYRPAFLTVIPRTESLAAESPVVLVLVVCLSAVVLCLLLAIICCIVRRRSKEPATPPDTAEVQHSLMPPPAPESVSCSGKSSLPLPPPPTPTQWPHLYPASSTVSSQYEGPTYEVPHPHGCKAPAPSLRYGYSGGHGGAYSAGGPPPSLYSGAASAYTGGPSAYSGGPSAYGGYGGPQYGGPGAGGYYSGRPPV